MNILFISLLDFDNLDEHNIYTDLLRQFVKRGHSVIAISPFERGKGKTEGIVTKDNGVIVKIKVGNMQKVSMVKKGISTLQLEGQLVRGIKKFLSNVTIDLIIYTTPPITFQKAVAYVKKRDHAITYLLLKDIFPQNAVDIGILTKKGWKKILYNYFRKKECDLYKISDYIGCMSQANVEYVLTHNPFVQAQNIEVCPNSIEIQKYQNKIDKDVVRKKYDIPMEKIVFVYGGNLGKPQGLDDLLCCISKYEKDDIFFLIVGFGTEFKRLELYVRENKPHNLKLMKGLPKEEYDKLIRCCDVGMICLDKRFTIPNFPSRLLSYMQASMPVLAMTDVNTDIGSVIEEGKFGYWCENGDAEAFLRLCDKLLDADKRAWMGDNARRYLEEHYSVEKGYEIICKRVMG